jgi:hypothetical protein
MHTPTRTLAHSASPALTELARPVLWLAAIAFLAGFIGYLLVAAPVVAHASEHAAPRAISGPVSQDWNLRKAI